LSDIDPYILDKLIEISHSFHKDFGCHGWEHTERVIGLCKFLGQKLEADMKVLIPAAILHDIGRGNQDHAIQSSKMSEPILNSLGFDNDSIGKIQKCIITHSFTSNLHADSLEAMILSDADKLDATGAIGVYRAAMFNCEKERHWEDFISHFYEKLLKIRNILHTDEARHLANERHRFLEVFLESFKRELQI
jgi:uncharacterized protein